MSATGGGDVLAFGAVGGVLILVGGIAVILAARRRRVGLNSSGSSDQ